MIQKLRGKNKDLQGPKEKGLNSSWGQPEMNTDWTTYKLAGDRAPVWPLRFSFLSRMQSPHLQNKEEEKSLPMPLSGLCMSTEEKEKSAVPTRVSLPFKVLPGSSGCFQNWLDALRPKFEICPEHRKKGSLPSYLPFVVTYRWRSTKRRNSGGSLSWCQLCWKIYLYILLIICFPSP